MAEKTINYIKLPDGETYKIGGSGSGFNLFDTKVSDHILEGEEALGWALQGTYVYKEGVAGSRTGYADFYSKCVEEYNNSILEGINTGTTYTQPVNPTGITATSGWTNAIDAFDGNASTYAFCGTTTDYIEWDLGQTLFISGFSATGNWVSGSAHASDLNIYKVNDDGSETLIAKGTGHTDSDTYTTNATFTPVGCTKIRFRLNETATSGTQAPVRIRDIKITATLGIEILVNNNKHKFYPISQKPYIDSFYESTGIADFYGIDLVNERIFLPRNDYFVQLTGDTSKVNKYVEAGLPNITGTCNSTNEGQPTGAVTSNYVGSYGIMTANNGGGYRISGVDASKSNSIYGKSNTVQPPSSLKLLYYCVGNTKVESAISNVTEITTSENDTLPLFYNFYSKEDMTTTGAYVNASLGSWLSGNVYTTAYNELVNKLGTDNVKANTDTYTDYDFVVNQDDITFRLPLLNGNEDLTSEAIISTLGLPEKPTSTKSYYTAPYNGFINIIAYKSSTSNTFHVEVNGVLVRQTRALSASNSEITLFVKKGDEIAVYTDSASTGWIIGQQSFIKATGNGNLYYKVANAVTSLELLDVAKVMNAVNTVVPDNASLISSYSMPSDRYIDLTLGASGSTYTAPANGWVTYEGSGNNVVAWLHLLSGSEATVTSGGASQSYANVYATIPVKKGDTFKLVHSTTTNYFRFIYAEGEV